MIILTQIYNEINNNKLYISFNNYDNTHFSYRIYFKLLISYLELIII